MQLVRVTFIDSFPWWKPSILHFTAPSETSNFMSIGGKEVQTVWAIYFSQILF